MEHAGGHLLASALYASPQGTPSMSCFMVGTRTCSAALGRPCGGYASSQFPTSMVLVMAMMYVYMSKRVSKLLHWRITSCRSSICWLVLMLSISDSNV